MKRWTIGLAIVALFGLAQAQGAIVSRPLPAGQVVPSCPDSVRLSSAASLNSCGSLLAAASFHEAQPSASEWQVSTTTESAHTVLENYPSDSSNAASGHGGDSLIGTLMVRADDEPVFIRRVVPEPASLIVWSLLGLIWARARWRQQFWQQWWRRWE